MSAKPASSQPVEGNKTMKLYSLIALVFAGAFAVLQPLHSQTAAHQFRSTREELGTVKEANQKLLDQQKATLQKLEEMQKEAGQLRILVRRT